MAEKLFVGPRVRSVREEQNLTQASFAEQIGISTSYLNQIENNQRPLTTQVMLGLGRAFNVSITELASNDTGRVLADLKETLAEPFFRDTTPGLQELKLAASNSPWLTEAFLALHQSHRKLNERLMVLDDALSARPSHSGEKSLLPYEEVRDYFHYHDNYIDELDRAAETLALQQQMIFGDRRGAFQDYLHKRHNVRVHYFTTAANDHTMRQYDPDTKILTVTSTQDPATIAFLLAHQIAILEHSDLIDARIANAGFRSEAAESICRIGLANYIAGALMMPYHQFLEKARSTRHDIDQLRHIFGASFEQISHRLSMMQRPGDKGIPFYFVRVDRAGNITKRHSATRFQFARFGGACPLWNVHEAFEAPGKMHVQIAEMPDGVRYLCLATSIAKRGAGYRSPVRRYAIGIGCEVSFADSVIYSDGLDLKTNANVERIGVSCRICERNNCHQRAVPPVDKKLIINPNKRRYVPFELG